MNIFDPQVSGSLSVSGSGQISGDLTVLGTLFATVSGTTENAVSASHAAAYTLTSSFHQHTNSFNSFTSSYSTGSFTGSFVGNGSGLYNIPASGVTGLNLSQISQGIATASISQANGLLINTNTEITGNLKVNNINVGTNSLVTISVSDSGGKYFIDNVRNPQITLVKGFTYRFLYSNINAHPFRFSTTNDGSHNGGTVYSTGVTTGTSPNYIQIEVTDNTPSTLYYYCTAHPGMGSSISVVSDLMNLEADRGVVYIDPSRIATTGSNSFTGSQVISGSLSVTGSVNITGSISLNGQPIGTGKLDETVFNSYTSSNDPRVVALEVSTGSLNSFTSSIDTTIKNKMNTDGVVSSSIQVSITGTTDFTTFSTSISQSISNSLLDSKNYTDLQIALLDFASPLIPFEQFSSSINTYTSSANNRLNSIESTTGSLNTFTGSANSRITSLELASGSIRTDFNSYTSSNNTTNTTQNSRLTALESTSASVNSYTSSNTTNINAIHIATSSLNSFSSSILGTIEVTGSNLTVKGNLLVKGTTTQIDSTTVNIGDNIIQLNGTGTNNGGLVVQDPTGASTISGSLLWDSSLDYWKAGKLGSEERIILVNEYNTFSTSIDSRATSIQNTTASLNSYTSSNNTRLGVIESTTSSLNTFTSSTSGRLNSLESASSSIRTDFNTYTSSNNTRLGVIESTTGSLNNYTSSANSRFNSIETSTGSLNSYTSSTNSRLNTIESTTSSLNTYTSSTNTRLGVIESTTSSLNSYTSSTNTRLGVIESTTGSLNTFTSSANSRLNSLESASSSIRSDFNTYTSSNNTTNTTQNSRLSAIETSTGSLNTYTSSQNTINSGLNSTTASLNSFTSSTNTRLGVIESTTSSLNSYTSSTNNRLTSIETSTGSLNSFTNSINTTIKNRLNAENVVSGSAQITLSNTTGYSTFSSSLATTDAGQDSRLNSIEGKTGSYATTGSNIFQGNQTITGSLYISQDLIVAGSSSIQNISSSIVNIADNIITVNALNPSLRFGGLAVIDSGSSPQVSGSMLFDSVNNQWIFVHQNQAAVTSSVLLMGPETFNNLGGESYLTQNRLPKGTGIEHLVDSNITDTGTKVSINSNTEVTGTLVVTQNISSPNITAIQTSTGSLNNFTSSLLSAIELTGSNLTVRGNLLVKGTTTNVNTTTLDVDNNLINLNGTGATFAGLRVKDTTAPNQISGSLLWDATNDYWIAGQLGSEQRIVRETEFNNAVTRIGNVEVSTSSLNSYTSSTNTRLGVIESTTSSLNSYTSSTNTRLNNIETSTGSLNTFTSSANGRLNSLESASGSIRTDFNTYTSSNNSTNTTQNNRLNSIESTTGSLNSYTSSNTTNINAIHTATGSLNTFTSSANSRLNSIETSTGSLNSYTSSTNTRLGVIESTTGSLNSYTSSNTTNINAIHTATSSLNSYTSSNNTRLGVIESTTASLNTFTSSANNRLNALESTTSSLNSYTSSNTTNINAVHTATSSLNTFTSSASNRLSSIESTTGSLNSYTSSNTTNINAIHTATSSLNSFTNSFNSAFSLSGADVTVRGNLTVSGTTTTINSTTVNIADNVIQLNGSGVLNAGLVVRDATASTLTSGSLLWDTTNDKWIAGPLGAEDDVVLRTATQTLTNKTINASQLVDASVTNAKLANSSFNIGTTSISLGRASASQTLTGVSIDGNAGTVTNGVYTTGDQTIAGTKTFSSNIINSATADWYMYGFGSRGASSGQYGMGLASDIANRTLSFHIPNHAAYSSAGSIPKFGWYSNNATELMTLQSATGNLVVTGTINGLTVSGGTITSGTWNGTAIGNAYLANSSFHIGTTSISLGRGSASQTLTGVSIDGNAATVTNGVYTTGDQSIAGTKTFTGTINVTASEGREITTYMPASYTTNDLVSGHEYGWYSDHWRLGMTRSGGAAGADFVIQWNGDRRLSLTSGGNLTATGTINGLTVSSGTITSGTWNGTAITNTYLANSSFHIGTTSISLGRASGAQTLSGVSIDGVVTKTIAAGSADNFLYANVGTDDYVRVRGGSDGYNSGWIEIATSDDGTEPIFVRQYTGVFTTVTRTATLLDGSGNTSFPGTVTAPTFSGALSGNASTASSTPTLTLTGLGNATVNVNNGSSAVYRNESGTGAALAYAPVLHLGGGDTMWQIQGSYGTSGNGTLYFRQGYSGSWGNWLTMISSANIGSQSVNYAATAGSADQIDGIGFRNTNTSGVAANSLDSNGLTYVTDVDGSSTNLTGNSTDGALYSQIYSSSWQHQIYGDYRTGIMYVRGKNNGTWASWKRVAMSNSTTFSNVSSVTFTHNLGTANLTAQVFDSNGDMFFPSELRITSTQVIVTFAANRTGRLVVTG